MLSPPDTLWVVLARFVTIAERTTLESTFMGKPTTMDSRVWPCLIVEVLATCEKFLESFYHCIVIKKFLLRNRSARTRKVQVPVLDYRARSLCDFKITRRMKQHKTCQRTNYCDTTDHRGYLSTDWTASVTWYRRWNLAWTKNFWLTHVFTSIR